jgi:hypothetical protein
LRLFASFFTNCVELNLWLTRCVVELCACRYRTPEGWLLFKPEDGFLEPDAFINTLVPENHTRTDTDNLLAEFSEMADLDDGPSDDESVDFALDSGRSAHSAKKKPTFTRFPQLFTMLKTLRAQVQHYKSELADEDFEALLEERRRALGFLDGISSAMNTAHLTPPRQPRSQHSSAPRGRTHNPPSTTTTRSTQSVTSRSSSSSSLPSNIPTAPFSTHFDRTRKLIQPLFPMGMDTPGASPENSFADLSDLSPAEEGKRRTGEFEPPEEISMGRLLNNIIVFEVCLGLRRLMVRNL